MSVPFVDLQRLHEPHRGALIESMRRVLESGHYVQSHEVQSLEEEFGGAMGAKHAIAVSNGTTALHLALTAAGVGPGDEVITVANTFIATAEAISQTGATPVFVDIDRDGFNMDPSAADAAITPRTRAIVVVHLYGAVAAMDALTEIARRHDLLLIEDACQAHGAFFGNRRAGTIGDAGCFSFYPTKNLGAIGEGGAVLTSNDAIASRARVLRDHGQDGRHHHVVPGFNYRMNELQAACLRVLLPCLEEWNSGRRNAAELYREVLSGRTELVLPRAPGGGDHVYHLFVVRSRQRDALAAFLRSRNIDTAIHYPKPIHRQPAYTAACTASLPNTERAVSEILSLPMHPGITAREIDEVAAAITAFEATGHAAAQKAPAMQR